jgi:outer membrane protein OmpA-like peptidoglycan-associated protein
MKLRLAALALVAAGYLLAGTGCANNKTTAERDSLIAQNKDLQQQLDAANQQKQADAAKIAAMSNQLTAAPPANASEGPAVPGMAGPVDLSGGNNRITRPTGGGASTPVRTAAPKARTKVTIPGNVLFDSGKTALSASATKTLDTIAATIKKSHSGEAIVIEGYTDSTPVKPGSALKSNEALATARATAVKNYLAKKGIPASDMTIKALATSDPASTKNQALNRRVEVAVMVEK